MKLQKVAGRLLMGLAAVAAFYYTCWTIVLPFVDAEHRLQSYFPPRRFAVVISSIAVVFGLGVLGIWVAVVLLLERIGETGGDNRRRLSFDDKMKRQ